MAFQQQQLPFGITGELYIKSFYKHPFIVNDNSVKSYILIKKITEMIEDENGIKAFDIHLHPDDIEISTDDDLYFDVNIPNNKYDENEPESYANSKRLNYEFIIETMEEAEDRVNGYIMDDICNTSPQLLLDCVREDANKVLNEREQREQSETTYDNDCCPICFEDYENGDDVATEDFDNDVGVKKVAICGHTLCYKCWHHITHSRNSVCPECREVWNEATEETEYTLEDIEMLCEDESNILFDIIDTDRLVELVLQTSNSCDIIGFDFMDENTEGFDTPDKYRERIGGGYEYTIWYRKD
jgi:hypothetical protein